MLSHSLLVDLSSCDRWPVGATPIEMAHSDATAKHLFRDGAFGADVIRFPAGGCVPDHTHPGAHILYVLSGRGWLDYEGTATMLRPRVDAATFLRFDTIYREKFSATSQPPAPAG